jgi:hypothetical protein
MGKSLGKLLNLEELQGDVWISLSCILRRYFVRMEGRMQMSILPHMPVFAVYVTTLRVA